MRVLRTIAVYVTWPIVYALDRLHGVDPAARFSTGMRWARTGERQDLPRED